jgi:hypothetical protein
MESCPISRGLVSKVAIAVFVKKLQKGDPIVLIRREAWPQIERNGPATAVNVISINVLSKKTSEYIQLVVLRR